MSMLANALDAVEEHLQSSKIFSEREYLLIKIASAQNFSSDLLRPVLISAKQAGITNEEIDAISELVNLMRVRTALEIKGVISPTTKKQECCR